MTLFRPLPVALLAAAFLLPFASPGLRAQPAAATAAATGEISGRIQNEVTGVYLARARVSVRGTDLSAFTDEFGSFRLSGVPSGNVVLEAFYSGLDPQQVAVTVPAPVGPWIWPASHARRAAMAPSKPTKPTKAYPGLVTTESTCPKALKSRRRLSRSMPGNQPTHTGNTTS